MFATTARLLIVSFVLSFTSGVRPVMAQTAPTASRRELPATTLPADSAVPTIDGRVTDDVWQQATSFADFTQQDPIEGAPATERTDVRVLFTATHVYIG